jgi:autotransporter-associated beta strand protein
MLTMATSNSFGGGVELNSGRLRAGTSSAFGSGTLAMTGGQLSSNSTTARSLPNGYILSGSLTLGDTVDTGGITLLGGGSLAGNTTIDVPTATTVNQVLGGVLTDGAGSFSLTKRGSTGVLVLSGANTYDGGTFIEEGRVNIRPHFWGEIMVWRAQVELRPLSLEATRKPGRSRPAIEAWRR